MIYNYDEVSNFNQSFLKLNRFIFNYIEQSYYNMPQQIYRATLIHGRNLKWVIFILCFFSPIPNIHCVGKEVFMKTRGKTRGLGPYVNSTLSRKLVWPALIVSTIMFHPHSQAYLVQQSVLPVHYFTSYDFKHMFTLVIGEIFGHDRLRSQ